VRGPGRRGGGSGSGVAGHRNLLGWQSALLPTLRWWVRALPQVCRADRLPALVTRPSDGRRQPCRRTAHRPAGVGLAARPPCSWSGVDPPYRRRSGPRPVPGRSTKDAR
jgi:hypothetical protein